MEFALFKYMSQQRALDIYFPFADCYNTLAHYQPTVEAPAKEYTKW